MNQVGLVEKIADFFLHHHIEKKFQREALVCLEKIIAVIVFWLFVMDAGDPVSMLS